MSFDPGRRIRGVHDASWTDTDLWVASLAIGGTLDRGDVAAITAGDRRPTRLQYDVLAAALNEHLTELGHHHPVPPWDTGS